MNDAKTEEAPGSFLIDRRKALQLTFAAGVSATSITLAVLDPAQAASSVFLHGVASGDPLADRVVIWTRVTVPDASEDIRTTWTVARDEAMSDVVRTGKAFARATRDFTVKVDVDGLEAGSQYYYRFEVPGAASPVGRTRTLPKTGVEQLKFAVFSCSNFELGYFNAYGEAARRNDLDAVIHLGDYIYEYGPGLTGYTTPATALGIVPKPRDAELEPREEIIALEQYRARHALYRTDPDLQKLHRKNPFINIWDDHEVANDAWTGGAENHDPETEGRWQQRKKAGIRAFYEWLPIREPEDGERIDPATRNPANLYRIFDFGGLARLVMLDTREAGRDQQLDTTRLVGAYSGAPAEGPFPRDVNEDGSTRELLGAEQEQWLNDTLAATTQTWQLIGNQVLMFYQSAPDILGSKVLTADDRVKLIANIDQLYGPGFGDQLAQLGAAGLPSPLAADAWTGYPTARIRMLETLSKASNPVVLTGDSHNTWVANLFLPSAGKKKTRVAPEFGGTSVSSPGIEQYLMSVAPETIAAVYVETSASKSTDDLFYSDQSHRGFMIVDVREQSVTVDHVLLSTVFETTYTTEVKRFRVSKDSRRARQIF